MKNWIALALLGVAGYIAFRIFNKPTDLSVHLDEQRQLAKINEGVNAIDQGILNTYPLTTIGDTPFAGIAFDPFDPESISSKPKGIELYPGIMF